MTETHYDLRNQTGFLIRRAYLQVISTLEKKCEQFGVTAQQFMIMQVIDQGLADSPARIAKELGIDSAAITRLTDRLVKKDLIGRRPCVKDRRVCFLELTKEGKQLMPQLVEACRACQAQLEALAGEQNINLMNKTLTKILES